MSKALVLDVDAQSDFINASGALAIEGAEKIIAPMERFLASLDPEKIETVAFTFDTHEAEVYAKSAEGQIFDPHCEKGTPGWQLVLDTKIVPSQIPVYTLEKGVFNMWEEDDLTFSPGDIPRDDFFEQMKQKGVDTVIVIGVAADYCVKDAIAGLLARGFKVKVVRDLTAGIERDIDQTVAEEFAGQVEIV